MKMNKNFQKYKRSRPVISFVVDGKCEVWYLQLLKKHERENAKNVNIEPELPQKKKLKDQFDVVVELSKESDKVFWIVDFDTIMKETREAPKGTKTPLQEFQRLCNKCKSNKKIVVIVNNPCLEYWFLLHFEQTSKYFATYKQLEKPLKKHLLDYEKTEKYYKKHNNDIYQRLKTKLSTASLNSNRLGDFDFNNPRTGIAEMHKIFSELGLIERKQTRPQTSAALPAETIKL